ncbi:hypothetical protein P4H71_20475 [Paenibacillus kribbensis]|uniref:hypothetical protein n=1 Tax=Paenibacillus kribbensis TaxID=172713 RepID=UPI002DBA797B|nr:hypothetical protein [Paenibacillus kribbensis]MEC0236698.1 hypothetical protein [Paenibacillus kribbensis]
MLTMRAFLWKAFSRALPLLQNNSARSAVPRRKVTFLRTEGSSREGLKGRRVARASLGNCVVLAQLRYRLFFQS